MARASSLEEDGAGQAEADSARQLLSLSTLSSLAPSERTSPNVLSPTSEREADAFVRRPSTGDGLRGHAKEPRSHSAELAQLDAIVKAAEQEADKANVQVEAEAEAEAVPVRLPLETSTDKMVLEMPELLRALTLEDL